jgi:hypothetical protein
MEITDEKLRQIVRETLRELGPDADPALVRKVVRDVVRHLVNDELHRGTFHHPAPKPPQSETTAPRAREETSTSLLKKIMGDRGSPRPEY